MASALEEARRLGAGWVLGQGALFLVYLASLAWPAPLPVARPLGLAVGASLGLLGVGVGVAAMLALGRYLTPFPAPAKESGVVRRGPFAAVRHPIYAGLLLTFVGGALALDRAGGLPVAAVALVFFWAKAGVEERALLARHGDAYEAYRETVRARLLPFLL